MGNFISKKKNQGEKLPGYTETDTKITKRHNDNNKTPIDSKFHRVDNYAGEITFVASCNQLEPANITGLAFCNEIVRSFNVDLSVNIQETNGENRYTLFKLTGIQRDNDWILGTSYIGDYSGIFFSITNLGQVQYMIPKCSVNAKSITMKFHGTITSV